MSRRSQLEHEVSLAQKRIKEASQNTPANIRKIWEQELVELEVELNNLTDDIEVIPASAEISMTCIQLGIPQTTLWNKRPDWVFDGADEVDPEKSLIKGRGGAMFKEKLLIKSSSKSFIIIDDTKLVDHLGSHFPIPVEVFPGALTFVESEMQRLGASDVKLRLAGGKDGPVFTENGNFIFDTRFSYVDPFLEQNLKAITGVIESGLFIGYDVEIVVAK